MSTTSSTPMPATGSLQLVEAVIERFDGAPVGERRRWSDEFKAQAVAAALKTDAKYDVTGAVKSDVKND